MTKLAYEKGTNLSLPVIFLLFMKLLICTHRRAMQRTASLHLVAIANQGHTLALTKVHAQEDKGIPDNRLVRSV
jgi:hypothetical protein